LHTINSIYTFFLENQAFKLIIVTVHLMTLDHIIPHTFHCIFETISGNYRDREGEKLGDRELRGRTLPAVFRRERQRRGRRRRGGVRAGDNTVGEDTVVRGGGGGAPASGVVGEER
jgi:hypothetical protein